MSRIQGIERDRYFSISRLPSAQGLAELVLQSQPYTIFRVLNFPSDRAYNQTPNLDYLVYLYYNDSG